LSLLILPKRYAAGHTHHDPPLVAWLKERYEKILHRLVEQPGRSLRIPMAVLVMALIILPFLGEEFLPHFKEYDFLMHWVEKPGTSLEAMDRITIRASKELRAVPGFYP
jgi:Cu/Ag efflux pump CusA